MYFEKPIIFTGLMGVGKSTIGRRISKILDIPFFDLDIEIEKETRCKVLDIFEYYGENEFRRIENIILNKILQKEPFFKIISTGEGTFINKESHKLIKKQGLSVWLKAEHKILVKRINKSNNIRPQIKDKKRTDIILKELIKERYNIYSKSDITINIYDENINNTVDNVISILNHYINN